MGNLKLQKRDQYTIIYRLTGLFVKSRLNAVLNPSFNLEAGFLAEQIQQQESIYTEAFYELQLKKQAITITLKQDTMDLEPLEQTLSFFTLTKPIKASESLTISEKSAEENRSIVDDTPLPTDEMKPELENDSLDEALLYLTKCPFVPQNTLRKNKTRQRDNFLATFFRFSVVFHCASCSMKFSSF